jgi:methionyl-tRNA formyltransferase
MVKFKKNYIRFLNMRLLFLGSPEFAVPSLKALFESGHEIIGVITQPDKPSGRGSQIQETPVKSFAIANQIPVFTPETCRSEEVKTLLKSLNFDLGVVVAYGNILPQAILDIPSKGFINAHGSLLPKYRGASPIVAPLLNGDDKTGISIQKMVKKVDAGDVILSLEINIEPTETAQTLHDKLSELSAKALLQVCDLIENNKAKYAPQDESQATFVGKLNKEMGKINWAESANVIERKIRAFTPWPGSYCFAKIAGTLTRIKITKATIAQIDPKNNTTPGKVLSLEPFNFIIGTGNGALRILEMQRDGKKIQDTATFLNGNRISKDDLWE